MPDVPPPSAPLPAPTREARERVVELLSLHFAEDRLSMEEFERRVTAAYAAPRSADLEALVADLPAPSAAPAATGAATTDVVPAEGKIVAVLSSNERRGHAIVPRHLKVVSVLGNAELDLRRAVFAPGVTEIEVKAVLGNVEITLPAGVRVEMTGQAFLASFGAWTRAPEGDETGADTTLPAPRTPEIVVRLTGRAVLASVEVRAPKRASREELPSWGDWRAWAERVKAERNR